MTITVVGGTYFERCLAPEFHHFYGSGGRAAAALSGQEQVNLHTYASEQASIQLKHLAERYQIRISSKLANQRILFEYDHGLSPPRIFPPFGTIKQCQTLIAEGEVVLLFGMLEGCGQVCGDTVVYDPQSELAPIRFRDTGSKAGRLAVVANAAEVRRLTGLADMDKAGRALMQLEKAQAVFIKLGANGMLVGEGNRWKRVPAYFAERVVPIGSGDVFSAAITLFWGKQRLSALEAGDLASRCTADYVERRALPILTRRQLRSNNFSPVKEVSGLVYLAGPFFDLQQRRLIGEVLEALGSPTLRVFSPLHDVGRGKPDHVARSDLAALRKCDRVFAILEGCDPGTLFEVGYARAKGIPVFGYVETMPSEQRTMFEGSGCMLFADIVTAIYRTAWKR